LFKLWARAQRVLSLTLFQLLSTTLYREFKAAYPLFVSPAPPAGSDDRRRSDEESLFRRLLEAAAAALAFWTYRDATCIQRSNRHAAASASSGGAASGHEEPAERFLRDALLSRCVTTCCELVSYVIAAAEVDLIGCLALKRTVQSVHP
jgi:hypothetical protein